MAVITWYALRVGAAQLASRVLARQPDEADAPRSAPGLRQSAGGEERFTHWIATIQYAYAAPSTDPKVRRWNPLGFKVIELTAEPEVLPQPPPPRQG